MVPGELQPHKPLQQYGFDSISCIQLLQQLQSKVDPLIALTELQACHTVQDMMDLIAKKKEDTSLQNDQARTFPELIPLNDGKRGRPVFWFHGGVGGVEIYQQFAQKSQRPFTAFKPEDS